MGINVGNLAVIDGGLGGAAIQDQNPIAAPIAAPLRPHEKWLSSEQLASLAEIDQRRVRRALQRGLRAQTWRGVVLMVREVEIGRGGAGGKALQVNVDSLPYALKEQWYLERGIDLSVKPDAPEAASVNLELDPVQDALWQKETTLAKFRHHVIAPALLHPKNKAARGKAVKKILETDYMWPDGTVRRVKRQTVYDWIKKAEAGGLFALTKRGREDRGKRRVLVTKAWDDFFADRTTVAQREAVAEDIIRHTRGLWAAGSAGWSIIVAQSTTRLIELSYDLGVPAFQALPLGLQTDTPQKVETPTKFSVCLFNRRRVEDERKFAILAVKDKNNAEFHNIHAPRIARDYSQMRPREIVVGDVHPVDVMMLRPDGSKVWPKAISWFDPCTNEVHMTFVLLEKGEGVRREHIAMSFEAMVAEWGLPSVLYLDNGSEYADDDMVAGFTMLSKMAASAGLLNFKFLESDPLVADRVRDAREAVVRSLPYNATGKPGIEGVFGNLEKVFFSTLEGWTAGDRMNQRTHQKGKDPAPFPGGAEAFLEQAGKALELYHTRPQYGRLNGQSPNGVLASFVGKGWGKTALANSEALALAFSTEETRVPDRGVVTYKPKRGAVTRFYADELLPLTGQKITIRVPAYSPDYVFCFKGDELICMARPEETFHPLDGAGAAEWGRRNKVLRRVISERRKHCALLDLHEETKRHLGHMPAAPDVPVAAVIDTGTLDQMVEMERAELAAIAADQPPKPKSFDPWGVDTDDFTGGSDFLEDDE